MFLIYIYIFRIRQYITKRTKVLNYNFTIFTQITHFKDLTLIHLATVEHSVLGYLGHLSVLGNDM